ncbi:MAG: type II toxin-antitoxin system VapC family toxin [Alkalispirochaeta sp.]
MTVTVLDTSACAAVMRRDPAMEAFLHEHNPGDLALVPPVVAEIEYGIRRLPAETRKRTLLEQERDRLLELLRILEWTPEASRTFGTVKAQLESAGTPIDDMDVAIAAVAMSHGASLVTANLVHFSRITGLEVRHW